MDLVLSLFPGLGVFDHAFAEEGYCVVRGPDVVWQDDIRGWSPAAGKFEGVIGGPPCQEFSRLRALGLAQGHEPTFGNLIPEFERCVAEARPAWYVMENVPDAPLPDIDGYDRWPYMFRDHEVGGVQMRERRFTLGLREPWHELASPWTMLEWQAGTPDAAAITGRGYLAPEYPSSAFSTKPKHSVSAGGTLFPAGGRNEGEGVLDAKKRIAAIHGSDGGEYKPGPGNHGAALRRRLSVEEMLEAQGLPVDYLEHAPYTMAAKRKLVGNAVPMAMGRAVARVVRKATSGT